MRSPNSEKKFLINKYEWPNKPEYSWPNGKLKWIDGSKRKWNCKHVSKVDILVDSPDGLYDWNTDYEEPQLPYRYVFLDELFQFLETDIRTRPHFEDCECLRN